jgi:hypothetical protein
LPPLLSVGPSLDRLPVIGLAARCRSADLQRGAVRIAMAKQPLSRQRRALRPDWLIGPLVIGMSELRQN